MFSFLSVLILWMNTTLTVTSPDFKAGEMIPVQFTCKGQSTSPALHFFSVPAGAKSLAIIMHDPDAQRPGGFTHWVAWNILPSMTDIPRDFKGAVQGLNGADKEGYMGPCPPSGVHHYHFMVYALDVTLNIDPKSHKADLEKAMEGHVLAKGELVGLFAAGK
jgi:Raf kinase inhibitor-like YbhB/YbcL family protein